MTQWSPKPLRPETENPLFRVAEKPTVVKSLTPIERQRLHDGTPVTRSAPTRLRPPEPDLVLSPALMKGSLAENMEREPVPLRTSPQDPSAIVKAFLDAPTPAMSKSLDERHNAEDRFQEALKSVQKACKSELPDEGEEDLEKTTGGKSGTAGKAGAGMVNAASSAVKTVTNVGLRKSED